MAGIKALSVYLPVQEVNNQEIEQRIMIDSRPMEQGVLERLLGIRTRRFAEQSMQVSDIACEAARKVLTQHPDTQVDLLIFAAASSDLIEPATSVIIQHKLGLRCPTMDIKNACNSFVSAIQTASAFVDAGVYQNVLIVNGEKLSEVINFNPKDEAHLLRCLVGYGLGDAGAAMLISNTDEHRIVFQKFMTWGEHWEHCRVEGGGSMAFRNPDAYFFEGNARELWSAIINNGQRFVLDALEESGWNIADIDCMVAHQVSLSTTAQIAESIGLPHHKYVTTFGKYGNTAAATIPLAMHEALEEGRISSGSKVLVLGLGAGISISVQLIVW